MNSMVIYFRFHVNNLDNLGYIECNIVKHKQNCGYENLFIWFKVNRKSLLDTNLCGLIHGRLLNKIWLEFRSSILKCSCQEQDSDVTSIILCVRLVQLSD